MRGGVKIIQDAHAYLILFSFRLIQKATSTRLVRGGGRWGGVRLSSLGTRCIRKVRTVIIYRGFQIGDR